MTTQHANVMCNFIIINIKLINIIIKNFNYKR